jgi:hypothetical protein
MASTTAGSILLGRDCQATKTHGFGANVQVGDRGKEDLFFGGEVTRLAMTRRPRTTTARPSTRPCRVATDRRIPGHEQAGLSRRAGLRSHSTAILGESALQEDNDADQLYGDATIDWLLTQSKDHASPRSLRGDLQR